MQRAFTAQPWPEDETVRVRMGIHSGEASRTAVGLVGFDVHRAARIAAAANGGQVVLSASAADFVRESMPMGAGLLDLGLHRLKDLGRPEQVVTGPDAEVEATRLHGAADSMLMTLGEALEPLEAGLSKRSRDALRSSMGAESFNAEYQTGRTLPLEEILAIALGGRS